MNCPKCQTPSSGSLKFCPHCGEKIPERTVTTRRRFGLWIFLGALFMAAFIFITSLMTEETPLNVVKKQLKSISNNQLTEAYYAYTSKEFQASTSLDDFKKFIKSFPSLAKNYDAHLENLSDQNGLKLVKGVIKDSANHLITMHYQLIDQGDHHWKILNIKAIPTVEEAPTNAKDNYQEILQPIEDQLNAFDKGHFKLAYEKYTTSEFQQASSFETFQQFLSHFPILTSHTNFQLIDVSVKDHTATVETKFQNAVLQAEVEYTLLKKYRLANSRDPNSISRKHS